MSSKEIEGHSDSSLSNCSTKFLSGPSYTSEYFFFPFFSDFFGPFGIVGFLAAIGFRSGFGASNRLGVFLGSGYFFEGVEIFLG